MLILFVSAVLFSSPLILLLLFNRERTARTLGCSLLAASFAAATAYELWRIEWFDVWRHGAAPLSLMLTAYAPYVVAIAACGWLLGRMMLRRQTPPRLRAV